MNKNNIELLVPAGDFPSLIAGVEAGADAVYFGLQEFSMRAFSRNFKISDLDRMRKICDNGIDVNGVFGKKGGKKKVKMYMTLNTIIYNSELKKVEGVIKKVKDKVDAIICWDLAVVSLCRKYKVPFHISTQASISNSASAEFYKKLGAERAILARELDLKQIKEISKVMFVETFVHGAMCVAVSGRCFTSQFLFNKSANRGECIHPCRRAYIIKDEEGNELKLDNNRVMSAKDLCALPFIEDLKKAGIKSFKIEGRNRPAEYVSVVVSVYREAIDKKLTDKRKKELIEKLKSVYHRGFSSGFYLFKPGKNEFSDSENGEQTERKKYIGRIENYYKKIGVAEINIHAGSLKLDDEVYIIGNKTGIKRQKVKSMEIHHKQVEKVKKGDKVAIKLEGRKNDEVYLITSTSFL